MKNGKMQAKDIPDKDFMLGILFVKWKKWGNKNHASSSTWDVQRYLANQLEDIRPWRETFNQDNPFRCGYDELDRLMPHKLVTAKARALIRRGLIDGCPCGCRGDFEVLPKGFEALMSS